MLLKNKNAIVYGAAGSLGSTVAKTFAREGATVFLCGRTQSTLEEVRRQIVIEGGRAEVRVANALDEQSVNACVQHVLARAATIDVSFCAIDYEVVQNIRLVEMNVQEFATPVTHAMESHFLTATAAARVMMTQRSGVILTLTATPGGIGYPFTGGFAPACTAIETFSRNLASELGVFGIRAVNLRSAGSPDSKVFKQAMASQPKEMEPIIRHMESDTMLKSLPLMQDIANAALFACSDLAKSITGVTIDVTAGTTAGFNYKVSRVG